MNGLTRTTKVQLVAAAAALALVSMLVLRASSAAFSGTTENAGNAWTAGTVTLTDNDGGQALFTSGAMVPGDTETKCIEVTYEGSVATSGTAFYVSSYTDTDADGDNSTAAGQLSDDLDVTVEIGDAGTTCTDLLGGLLGTSSTVIHDTTALQALPADYASGGLSWTPTSSTDTMRAFHLTVTLGDDTANDAQGDGATATFTWEAQS